MMLVVVCEMMMMMDIGMSKQQLTCRLIPSAEQSKFACTIRSLMESRIFLNVALCARRASNMAVTGFCRRRLLPAVSVGVAAVDVLARRG